MKAAIYARGEHQRSVISGRAPEKGQPRGKEGLLERIGNRAIMRFPDFSTVLEGNRDKATRFSRSVGGCMTATFAGSSGSLRMLGEVEVLRTAPALALSKRMLL